MKVLVDECVPAKLARLLTNHGFTTAREKGWGSFKNGRLLSLAEPEFDLFLTCDRNLEYQQNLKGRKIGTRRCYAGRSVRDIRRIRTQFSRPS